MKPSATAVLAIILTCLCVQRPATAADDEVFRFAVFGDTQEETPEGHLKDLHLVAAINRAAPEFSVFIGDIHGGGPCSDEQRDEAVEMFAAIQGAVVYTPGDNEWTDCKLPGKGDWEPLERLQSLRKALVPVGRSLGQSPMPLEQQAGVYRENARWSKDRVVFVTLNMPGGNNGVYPDAYAFEEYQKRNRANLDWLAQAYQVVRDTDARALVVLFHGNPGWGDIYWKATAYRDFKSMLANEGAELGVPILAVHGDTHRFTVDKPLAFKNGKTRANHLTRLEVFGSPERGFVIVTVDPRLPELFSFSPVETLGRADTLK